MANFLFNKSLIIGVGLIGSSIARGLKNKKLSKLVFGYDNNKIAKQKCIDLKIVDSMLDTLDTVEELDLVILCTPLSSYNEILSIVAPLIKTPCIITDVGSTKVSVLKDFENFKNNKLLNFVPGHPIAGLEKSGPEYGFEDLFKNRYCILTPKNKEEESVKKVSKMWESLGMVIEIMQADRHDRILAITSHIPQLIAYSIVATSTELEKNIKDEVIKYSAAGFRDFTRLAGSDPIMWRDIYILNRDLSSLQKAIRNEDKNFLEKTFRATREIRKEIEKAGQAGIFDPREKDN